MANNTPPVDKGPPDRNPFDIRLVKQLVGLMRENELSEIALSLGDARVRLRRGGLAPIPMTVGAPQPMAPPSSTSVAPSASASDNGASASAAAETAGSFIKSPTVGTFYLASSPDSPPFVKVGSAVQPDTVVCMVEAMKVFNEIPAGVAGTILEVLVENAAPVEFGQHLFRVKPV
jgi:acetyl-CoA carboxylase biotin carboxyl carrier protein